MNSLTLTIIAPYSHTNLISIFLFSGTIMCVSRLLSYAQHWSHGWYPGGKRELDSFGTSEISEEIKLCEAGECSYLRPQRRSILRNILLDALARELQKRK
uniref:Progonadoliberin n=1 Tax=Stegastes partitus TaxID=144197 RepID=A0A3B5AW80_9TELE